MPDIKSIENTPKFGVPMNIGNSPQTSIQQGQMSAGQSPSTPQAPRHRGFLDHALGFLGDFLMSKLDMGRPYHDARENEKLNYARLLDQQDPSQTFAHVGEINPVFASKLAEQSTDNRRLDLTQQSTEETRAARIEAQREAIRRDVKNRAAGYFNNLASDPKGLEERYAAGRQLWQHSSEVQRDPELMDYFDKYYPEKL